MTTQPNFGATDSDEIHLELSRHAFREIASRTYEATRSYPGFNLTLITTFDKERQTLSATDMIHKEEVGFVNLTPTQPLRSQIEAFVRAIF